MTYPGTKSSIKTIEILCDKINILCRENKIESIAIPLLGCGIGGLNEEQVLNIFNDKFKNINDTKIIIGIKKE